MSLCLMTVSPYLGGGDLAANCRDCWDLPGESRCSSEVVWGSAAGEHHVLRRLLQGGTLSLGRGQRKRSKKREGKREMKPWCYSVFADLFYNMVALGTHTSTEGKTESTVWPTQREVSPSSMLLRFWTPLFHLSLPIRWLILQDIPSSPWRLTWPCVFCPGFLPPTVPTWWVACWGLQPAGPSACLSAGRHSNR